MFANVTAAARFRTVVKTQRWRYRVGYRYYSGTIGVKSYIYKYTSKGKTYYKIALTEAKVTSNYPIKVDNFFGWTRHYVVCRWPFRNYWKVDWRGPKKSYKKKTKNTGWMKTYTQYNFPGSSQGLSKNTLVRAGNYFQLVIGNRYPSFQLEHAFKIR